MWRLELYCSEKLERPGRADVWFRKGRWLSVGAGGMAPRELLKRIGSNRFVNRLLSAVKWRIFSSVNNLALTTVSLMLYRSVVS